MLGGDDGCGACGNQLAIALQPRGQLEALPPLLAAPERSATGGALLLELPGNCVERGEQGDEVSGAPAIRGGL